MSNYIYVVASLDGFIARKDGNIEWLNEIPNPEGSDFGFSDFMKNIDAVIMGRKTYEVVLSFGSWPYSKPVFVLSNSLSKIDPSLEGKCELINGGLDEILEKLKDRDLKHFYIDGGKTIQSFLEKDLIDEIIITRIPLLLGEGIPLFGKNSQELKYEHCKTEVLNNMLVKSQYKRKRE